MYTFGNFLCDRVYFWGIFYATGYRVWRDLPHPRHFPSQVPPGCFASELVNCLIILSSWNTFSSSRYASELILPRMASHHVANVPSLKELTDFQQLPENPLDMLARLFWVGVSLLESDFEHEFVMAIRLLEKVHYSQSGSSVPCKFEDYLKIDFHDLMTIRILLCYLLTSDSNVASVGRSV